MRTNAVYMILAECDKLPLRRWNWGHRALLLRVIEERIPHTVSDYNIKGGCNAYTVVVTVLLYTVYT